MPRLTPHFAAATLALLAALVGCSDENHDHDHDHDHAAHVDPPHWPADFPDAIARLLAGYQDTQTALSRQDSVHQLHDLLPVQRDLAKWLPEVAADSDMPEQPWNQVQTAAASILDVYEAALADLKAGRPFAADKIASAQPALETLRRLNQAADPSWFSRLPRATASQNSLPAPSAINNTATEAGNTDRDS